MMLHNLEIMLQRLRDVYKRQLLAPMMIGLEVFGGHQMIAFLIICIFAYLVNGNKSIYTAQIKNF